MRFLVYAGAFVLFCAFWLISTPVYCATSMLEWADKRLSRLLNELWEGL